MRDINILSLFGINVEDLELYEEVDSSPDSVTFLIRKRKEGFSCKACGSFHFVTKNYKLKKMDNFFNNNITYNQLIKCLTQLNIGDQYCLKSKKACNKLKCEVIYRCNDNGLRRLIRDYAFETTQNASKHSDAINRQIDKGKRFSDLIKEYGKKPLF